MDNELASSSRSHGPSTASRMQRIELGLREKATERIDKRREILRESVIL